MKRGLSPFLAGVDEAGRGPLAGPVFAAAVILDPGAPVAGLRDSKVMTAAAREAAFAELRVRALAWGVGVADAAEIDVLNIRQATFLAMRRALLALRVAPTQVCIDGNAAPSSAGLGLDCNFETVVRGDATIPAISAASIIAKCLRDTFMRQAAQVYPGYGFETHKGYPTSEHFQALARLGPSRLHRLSFAPLKSGLPRR
jgi:ribonuclease HII